MPATAAMLAALVLGPTAGAVSTDAGTTRPILQLRATAPLSVEGRGFVFGESIRVVAVTTGAQQTRTATASKLRRLKVRFALRLGRCAEATVRAVGSLGSRTVLRRDGACKKPEPKKPKR
ncbi:MAG: hypothetical protein WKF41_02440 [Gaiellaceae bacterium]